MATEGIIAWCNRIIHTGFYLLFGLVPLLLTPWNYELFEYNKMMAVYALTAAIVGSWLVKMVASREIRITKTPLDIAIALFVISQLLSSLFSIDPHVSWLGYYSRFNGGMLSVISYILLYYAFVTNWEHKATHRLGRVALSSGAIVALYGVAERLGVDKNLWVQDVQNRVFSTLGQPNWLAAYLVALTPIAMAFGLRTQNSNHNVQLGMKNFNWSLSSVFWVLVSALFFLVLLFTRSRSGLFAFAVSDIVFWGLLYWKTKQKLTLRLPLVAYHITLVILVFLNGSNISALDKYFSLPGIRANVITSKIASNSADAGYVAPLLETGGTESAVIRKYVWEGALNAWKSSTKAMMIGTGTETFAFAFYQYRPAGHNLTSEWDFLYNKAHNEYLNYLATTGLFGLGSYLLFIGSFIWWFTKRARNDMATVDLALFSGWTSILITNFFGFSVVVTQLFFFLFPAMYFLLHGKEPTRSFPLKLSAKSSQWSLVILLVALAALLVFLGRFWYADTLFSIGYRNNRSGAYEQAKRYISSAISLNPKEPLYHDELSTALAGLTMVAIESKEATQAARLAQESLRQNDMAIAISPRNVNFWKSRTKIFYAFSAFDTEFNAAAVQALEHALKLSPNDPKIIYNLAILVGRGGDNNKAIDYLKKANALKPDYRDAYYALSVFYTETNQPLLARSILEEYLTKVDPNDKDFQERVHQ